MPLSTTTPCLLTLPKKGLTCVLSFLVATSSGVGGISQGPFGTSAELVASVLSLKLASNRLNKDVQWNAVAVLMNTVLSTLIEVVESECDLSNNDNVVDKTDLLSATFGLLTKFQLQKFEKYSFVRKKIKGKVYPRIRAILFTMREFNQSFASIQLSAERGVILEKLKDQAEAMKKKTRTDMLRTLLSRHGIEDLEYSSMCELVIGRARPTIEVNNEKKLLLTQDVVTHCLEKRFLHTHTQYVSHVSAILASLQHEISPSPSSRTINMKGVKAIARDIAISEFAQMCYTGIGLEALDIKFKADIKREEEEKRHEANQAAIREAQREVAHTRGSDGQFGEDLEAASSMQKVINKGPSLYKRRAEHFIPKECEELHAEVIRFMRAYREVKSRFLIYI